MASLNFPNYCTILLWKAKIMMNMPGTSRSRNKVIQSNESRINTLHQGQPCLLRHCIAKWIIYRATRQIKRARASWTTSKMAIGLRQYWEEAWSQHPSLMGLLSRRRRRDMWKCIPEKDWSSAQQVLGQQRATLKHSCPWLAQMDSQAAFSNFFMLHLSK